MYVEGKGQKFSMEGGPWGESAGEDVYRGKKEKDPELVEREPEEQSLEMHFHVLLTLFLILLIM